MSSEQPLDGAGSQSVGPSAPQAEGATRRALSPLVFSPDQGQAAPLVAF